MYKKDKKEQKKKDLRYNNKKILCNYITQHTPGQVIELVWDV